MKKGFILLLLLGTVIQIAEAQTYIKPKYAARSLKDVDITKIEITDKYTIVHFYFNSVGETNEVSRYQLGGWIALAKNMYIKNAKTHKKYYLIKASNIPILPNKLEFQGPYKRRFKAYFPSIDPGTKEMHIIEEATNGFNFYKIKLKPLA